MIKTSSDFRKEIVKIFPYSPTDKQEELLGLLSEFLFSKNDDDLFLLKGYAGTGKTTIISTVCLLYTSDAADE